MTIEEKSERYIKKGFWKLNVGGWKARMKEAFIAGYTEATRWRDPKVELPKDYVLIGTQAEQKKYIGNAVEVNMAKFLCTALVLKLNEISKVWNEK